MGYKRGSKRLALCLGLPYFAWWSFLIVASSAAYKSSRERMFEAEFGGNDWSVNLRMMNEAQDRLDLAITWGLVVPVIALVIWGIGRWVYRGFVSE